MKLYEAIEEFTFAKTASTSPRTRVWYRGMLGQFVDWLEESGQSGSGWYQPATVERYLAYLQDDLHRSPSTIHGAYRALTVFFRWCERRGLVPAESSPMALVEEPLVPDEPPEATTVEEYRQILASIPSSDWIGLRDRCLVALLWNTGARVGEIAALRVGDLDTHHRRITIRRGKRAKGRIVPMLPDVAGAVGIYLMARPEWPGDELLLGSDGRQGVRSAMTVSGVRRRVRSLCERARVPYRKPHAWRHGLAMYLLNEAGADMSMIQRILGHSSVRTTAEIYARWTDGHLSAQFERAMAPR